MSNVTNNNKQTKVGKREWLQGKVVLLLTLLLAVAFTVVLFLYRDKVAELGNYGYLGAFLISLVANATVFLPMPGMLLFFALGATFNPVLVGLAGAAGGAIGELSGYLVGYSGRAIIRNNKMYARADRWMRRWGSLTLFAFSLIPLLPFDVAGVLAGVLRFPIWKFLLVCWLGKTILYIGLALAGGWGWDIWLRYFG